MNFITDWAIRVFMQTKKRRPEKIPLHWQLHFIVHLYFYPQRFINLKENFKFSMFLQNHFQRSDITISLLKYKLK